MLFKLSSFRMQVSYPSQVHSSTLHGDFFYSLFLLSLFGHLGDQCAFALMFLVSLPLCIHPPHIFVRIPLFHCFRASPGDLAIAPPPVRFYPDA